jgi:hypothetical protein
LINGLSAIRKGGIIFLGWIESSGGKDRLLFDPHCVFDGIKLFRLVLIRNIVDFGLILILSDGESKYITSL